MRLWDLCTNAMKSMDLVKFYLFENFTNKGSTLKLYVS